MPNASAEAFAPASMGNVGVGFDILGLAYREPGDIVCVQRHDAPGVEIATIEGDDGRLPRDPAKNSAAVAAAAVLAMIDAPHGVLLTLRKNMPLASGMGSSAASAVAAAVAVNALFDEPLSRSALLPACLEGEGAVSGYHADNVAPSPLGGITLINGTRPDQIRQLPVSDDIYFALVTPNVAVPTAEARAVLPREVPLSTMIAQTAAVASLIDALYRGDIAALAAAMEADSVVEPARTHLMPKLVEARTFAKTAGALALVISGAGPTLCAVCDSEAAAAAAARALQSLYEDAGIGGVTRVTQIDPQGARVLSVE